MKIITLLALAMLAAWPLFAQNTLTVDNNANSPGQYTNLQEAIDAAQEGDIILVNGSDNIYNGANNSNLFINKSNLTIIGAGYNNPYGKNASCGSIYISYQGPTVSGITIKGLQIQAIYVYPSSAETVSDVKLEDNAVQYLYMGYQGAVSGFVVRNNTIGSLHFNQGAGVSDVFISNNTLHSLNGSGTVYTNVIVQHNIFAFTNYLGNIMFGKDFVFDSNIFWKINPSNPNIKDCIFSSNIFYQSDNLLAKIGTDGNVGSNNTNATSDPIVSYDGTGYIWDKLESYNFHQSANPPLLNGQSEEIGVYGGTYKFTEAADVGANPNIPQMTSILIQNVSVEQGGTLNVSFEAKTQQ